MNPTNTKITHTVFRVSIVVILWTAIFPDAGSGFPQRARRDIVKGPWELVLQIGSKGQVLVYPVTVENVDQSADLQQVFPVMGTPVTVRLDRYLPDLVWDTTVVERPGAGVVAELRLNGPNLDKKMWLASGDPDRGVLTSSIGGVALKSLQHPATLKNLIEQAADASVVGVISAQPDEAQRAAEFLITSDQSQTRIFPVSKYRLEVLDYFPHYSVDAPTKKITNLSEKPQNPAVHIRVDDDQNQHQQWLWSNFQSSPHAGNPLPLKVQYQDFNLSGMNFSYILAAAPESEPWLFYHEKGLRQARKVVFGEAVPFARPEYTFTIDKITDNAELKMQWRNQSEQLLNPALVVTVEHNGKQQQLLLELNEPQHLSTDGGTAILLYRQKPSESPGPEN